jgi:tRNA(His) 5'-end guanylyltransferase
VIRVDGKAFHTFCSKMKRPYDMNFIQAMDATAALMVKDIMGSEFAYIQSDEISILLTDFAKPNTEAWFDGNIQKMCSVAAAMATAYFSKSFDMGTPMFDARVFSIPDHVEVENYFIWRQQDAVRNSILMLGQHYYSPAQMHGKNCSVVQDMIHDKGDNWNNHPARFKRGGFVWYDRSAEPYPAWCSGAAPSFAGEEDRPCFTALIPKHWQDPQ